MIPCPICGELFNPVGTGRPRKYCTPKCTKKSSRNNASKTCTRGECERPVRAKGLCGTHYNQQHPSPGLRAVETVECAGCGAQCRKRRDSRRPDRYCSLTCRTDAQWREVRARKLPVYAGPVWPRCDLPDRHPARTWRPSKPRVFVSGPCSWCGEAFTIVDQTSARYCSVRCSRNASRARTGRFVVSDSVRLAIYERDGWTCQLCSEPVDPDLPPSDVWAATLDHIVCQSWTDEPDHSPSNLRLAHRWCNSVRGDEQRYTAEDLLLVPSQ